MHSSLMVAVYLTSPSLTTHTKPRQEGVESRVICPYMVIME